MRFEQSEHHNTFRLRVIIGSTDNEHWPLFATCKIIGDVESFVGLGQCFRPKNGNGRAESLNRNISGRSKRKYFSTA